MSPTYMWIFPASDGPIFYQLVEDRSVTRRKDPHVRRRHGQSLSQPRRLRDGERGLEAHQPESELHVRVRTSDEAARMAADDERRDGAADGSIPERASHAALTRREDNGWMAGRFRSE